MKNKNTVIYVLHDNELTEILELKGTAERDNQIHMNQGIPHMGKEPLAFDAWLKAWHKTHNSPRNK
jgi:hypothetical protein